MAYTKTNWTNETPINTTNLNIIEDGIYNSSRLSSTEPNPKSDVWFKSDKNLINMVTLLKGYFYNNGILTLGDENVWLSTLLIPILPNQTYVFSHQLGNANGSINFFSSNKTYISNIAEANTTAFITPNNAYYVGITIWYNGITTSNETWVQLELGSTATTYEAYVEPNILVNHGNGYQEFNYNKNDTGWINCGFLNGWFNASTSYNSCQYRKIGKIVYIRGSVTRNNAFANNSERIVFNIPEGFRPLLDGFGTINNDPYNISANGDIYIGNSNTFQGGNWCSFDGLYYFVD